MSGYTDLILKSDRGPAVLSLLEAVKLAKAEAIQLKNEGSTIGNQVMEEEFLVGEHKSNGEILKGIQTVQGLISIRIVIMVSTANQSAPRPNHALICISLGIPEKHA